MIRFFSTIVLGVSAFAATPEQNWLNRAYEDLVNRPADATAQQFLAQANTQQGRQQIVNLITGSSEYRSILIQSMYSQYLKRAASPDEVSGSLGRFLSDELTRATVISSPEYFQTRDGNSVTQYISTMYGDLLNRQPSALEINMFNTLAAQGRIYAALAVLTSDEYRGKLAAADYLRLLNRPIDTFAANFALMFFKAGTDEQYLAMLISSAEYFADAQVPNGVDVTARFSQGSAVSFNTNPTGTANLVVQVTDLTTGNPVDGLTQSQFSLSDHFQLPTQNCGFSSTSIASFAGVGNGWYQMTVGLNPSRVCEWIPGDYLASIVVQGGRQGATVAMLSIQ